MSRAYRKWKERVKESRREGVGLGGIYQEFCRGFPICTPITSAPTALSFYMQWKRMVRREAKRYLKYKRDALSRPENREMFWRLGMMREQMMYHPSKEE